MSEANKFDLWLADRMKLWIDAIARSTFWTLSTPYCLGFPIYAGVPYGAQSVVAASTGSSETFFISAGFGAYQFKWDERMVRVDIYRHHTISPGGPLVEEWRDKAMFAFRDLIVGERFNDPEPRLVAEVPVGNFCLAGYAMGKIE